MTREAYTLDMRQFTAWCRQRQLRLFAVRRADIELFARDLEAAARARAAVTRRLSAIAGLYTYAVEEDLLDHSPAAHVRRPRIDYESRAAGLDRNEVGALLVAAGLGTAAEHAPISLLALNGLRVSEATGADVEALGTARGHRTLAITGKGGKKAVIPLAPRTARAVDLAIGDRCEGPIFRGRLTDWVSLGVLAAFVPRDAVDDAVAAAGRQARRSDGKLPPHVMVYLVMALALFADVDYEEVAARLTETLTSWGYIIAFGGIYIFVGSYIVENVFDNPHIWGLTQIVTIAYGVLVVAPVVLGL